MAAEETEYFSPTVGNGLTPIQRAIPDANKGVRSRPANKAAPFLQGITLGAVMMIPLGVWWWSQAPAMAAEDPPSVQSAAPAKPLKSSFKKKSASKSVAAPVSRPRASAEGQPQIYPGARTAPSSSRVSKPKVTGVEE